VTFLRLAATTEFDPRAVHTRRVLALLRFLTPTALPTHRGLPFPGFAYPGHVASLHLPCASTLHSLGELLGVLSTKRAHGAKSPTELDLAKIATFSRLWHPLMRLATLPRFSQTIKPTVIRLPETDRPPGSAPRPGQYMYK